MKKNPKIELRETGIFYSLFFAIFALLLNEFIFYYSNISYFINLAILSITIILLFRGSLKVIFAIMFVGFNLFTRPREIHILPLEVRGNFEYFSTGIQKFGPFSYGTTALILIGFLSFLYIVLVRKKNVAWRGNFPVWFLLFLGMFSGLIFSIFEYGYSWKYSTPVIRYLLFLLFGGYLIKYLILKGYDIEEICYEIIKSSFLCLFINIFMVGFEIFLDFYLSNYKLRYVTSSIYFSPILFYIGCLEDDGQIKRVVVLSLGLLSIIPLTRGEQLIFFVNLLIFIYFLKKQFFNKYVKNKSKIIMYVLVFLFTTIISLHVVSVYFPDSYSLFQRKISVFLLNSQDFDKSANVRVSEVESIFSFDNFKDLYYLSFGRGLWGFFELDPSVSMNLDFSDFSQDEIQKGTYYLPHSFFTFHILKFGILGLVVFIIFLVNPLLAPCQRGVAQNFKNLYKFFLPAFIYMGYSNPSMAFFSGMMIFSVLSISRRDLCLKG
jgi:hypothetical protein